MRILPIILFFLLTIGCASEWNQRQEAYWQWYDTLHGEERRYEDQRRNQAALAYAYGLANFRPMGFTQPAPVVSASKPVSCVATKNVQMMYWYCP